MSGISTECIYTCGPWPAVYFHPTHAMAFSHKRPGVKLGMLFGGTIGELFSGKKLNVKVWHNFPN